MSVGDILLWRDEQFGHHRAWKVRSILLGAENQEGLIEMQPMFEVPGCTTEGQPCPTVFVPEVLTRNLERFGSLGNDNQH